MWHPISFQRRTRRSVADSLAFLATMLLACPPLAAADAGVECDLVIGVVGESPLIGSMNYRLIYAGAPGVIAGHGSTVQCSSLLPTEVTAFYDNERTKAVAHGFVQLEGVASPADLASCVFLGSSQPAAPDFELVVDDAADIDIQILDPFPTLELSVVRCGPAVSTTTTTTTTYTTTSTMVRLCGDGTVGPYEQCDDGNTFPDDSCVNCQNAYCGDGFRQAGVEECDSFVMSDGHDFCVAQCKLAVCGDGFLWFGHEECDDGGTAADDGCSPTCQKEQLCGDPTNDGGIQASDALRVLQRAVRLEVDCPRWVCDVNSDGTVSAIDALALLRSAVSLPVQIHCGPPTGMLLRLVASNVRLGALQVDVQTTNPAGTFAADGDRVRCEGLIAGAAYAFEGKANGKVSIGLVAAEGFRAPRALARCEYVTVPSGSLDKFQVQVLEAVRPSGLPARKLYLQALAD